MRILIYKRTHIGDPNVEGIFGVNECMGRVRSYNYDAVIGVGGKGSEARSCQIDRKINWVGVKPVRNSDDAKVEFERFLYLEEEGPLLAEFAPMLAKRLYEGGARFLISGYSEIELSEAKRILEWSLGESSSPTAGVRGKNMNRDDCKTNDAGCPPKKGGC